MSPAKPALSIVSPTPVIIPDSEQVQQVIAELAATDPRDIVGVFDCDLTLANKPPESFHNIRFSEPQISTLRRASEAFAIAAIITARGRKSTLEALWRGVPDRQPIDRLVLASDCGHHVMPDASLVRQPKIYQPIGDMDQQQAAMVTQAIGELLDTVGQFFSHFGGFIIDKRKYCGALVYQGLTHEEAESVHSMFANAFSDMPHDVQATLKVAEKRVPQNDGSHSGYIDIMPKSMSKGQTLRGLLQNIPGVCERVPDNGVLLIGGDTRSDIPMMQMAKEMEAQGLFRKVYCFWVGNDRDFYSDHGIEDMIHLPGDQWHAIPTLYRILDAASAPAPTFGPAPRLTIAR